MVEKIFNELYQALNIKKIMKKNPFFISPIRIFIIPINGPTIGANKLHTLIIVIGGNYTYIYKNIYKYNVSYKSRGSRVFVFLEMGLYRSRIEFLVMFEVVQHCL